MTSSSSLAVRELPLFPLPEVILFPGRSLPLHIFEFRYRMMMNTILEQDRRFGVLGIDPINRRNSKNWLLCRSGTVSTIAR